MTIKTIPTNPDTCYAMGRNGSAKMSALQVWLTANGEQFYIEALNSRGMAVAGTAFVMDAEPTTLREAAAAILALADEAETARKLTK